MTGLLARTGAAMLALALAVAPAAAETLADAMAFGYENSGALEQNRALLRVADERVASAVAGLRPIVNWAAQVQGRYNSVAGAQPLEATLGLTASVVLWDGGRGALGVDIQREAVLATRQGLIQAEQQILLRIVQAYAGVRREQSFVDLRENNVRLITEQMRAAQDRFDVGEVTRTDVAQAEARLAAARSLLAAEQGNLAMARAEYEAAVGRRPGSLAPMPAAPLRQSRDEALAWAMRNHPAILQAQHSVAASELAVEVASRANRPQVTLQGQIGTTWDFDGYSESVTLGVGGPVYQGGLLASKVRQAMAQRDADRAALLTAAQTVTQNVTNAWARRDMARAQAQALERQVQAAQSAFDGLNEEAALGARTTLDVLNAEQELLDARANLISAQVDETVASYGLLSALGLLTAQNLGLNVQIYDPEAYYRMVEHAPAALSEQGQALDRVLRAIGE
ncbi:MAG: TolC family outer membrane protein [Rubellimicrobium sp.]|nr:TolC family outer membrane protein [Rubellimicrobium sp.]